MKFQQLYDLAVRVTDLHMGGKRNMDTKFSRWVKARKVASLAEELRALGHRRTEQAIYRWIATDRRVTIPKPAVISALVELSAGELSAGDVLAHSNAVFAALAQQGAQQGGGSMRQRIEVMVTRQEGAASPTAALDKLRRYGIPVDAGGMPQTGTLSQRELPDAGSVVYTWEGAEESQ